MKKKETIYKPEKRKVNKRIHTLSHKNTWYTYKDLKELNLEDDDVVDMGYQEAYDYGDSASDGFFYLYVDRMVLETDEEYEKRLNLLAELRKKGRNKRIQNFLETREEFKNAVLGERLVSVCDQGHYGSTTCSVCGEDVEKEMYECPKCNCIFTGIKHI